MSQAIEIVKKAYAAWETKDVKALRTLLHKDYKCKGPGMEMNGPAEAEQCLQNCPFEGHSENETFIVDGNKVVKIWDFVATAPVKFRARMAELNIVEDGKIKSNEVFFDPAQFPKETTELSKQKQAASITG